MTSISCLPNSNHLTIYSNTGQWLAVTGQVITGRGQRQNVLAKLSMLLIDNEAEFKAEFNLPSDTFMNAHSHTQTHTLHTSDYKGYTDALVLPIYHFGF